MKEIVGRPDERIIAPNAQKCGDSETSHLAPRYPLPMSKGPVLIEKKAIHRPETIGKGIEQQNQDRTGRRKQPEQGVQN